MSEQPYSVHEGLDYIVILGPGHDTTDNPLAKIVDATIARAIVEWLNYTAAGTPPAPVLLLPDGLRWETVTLLDSVARERLRQDAKWGGPAHDDEHIAIEWQQLIAHRNTRLMMSEGGRRPLAPEKCEQLFLEIAALALAAIESSKRLAVPAIAREPQ